MASYVVMEPPVRDAEARAILVRDGFHILALLLPVLWLLYHRLWIEAVVALGIAVVLGFVGSMAGFGPASSVLAFAMGLFVGMEGAAMEVATLRRRGWREWGVVEADGVDDAEIRYIAEAVAMRGEERAAPRADAVALRPGRPAVAPPDPALGILGYSGRS